MANTKATKKVEEKKETVASNPKISGQTIMVIISLVLVAIIVGIYIFKWQQIKNMEEYNKSYLLDSGTVSLEIKNLDEVSQILAEAPTEYYILITSTGEKNNYELENNLKTIIDKNKLNDSFYYLNVDNIKTEDNYLTQINSAFNTDKIKKVPTILYYKDNELVDLVKRDDNNCINAADFQKLLDIYK